MIFFHPFKTSFLIISILFLFNSSVAQHWDLTNPDPTYNYLQGIDFINKDTGYICGYDGDLFKTEDRGFNWKRKESNICYNLWSIAFINADTGFAVGNAGTIIKTTDEGETWTQLPQPVPTDLFYIYFFDNKNGWITGTYNTILRTHDGGNSWELLSHSIYSDKVWSNVEFINPDTGYLVGEDGFGKSHGLLKRTFDGGDSWEFIDTPEEIEFIRGFDVINENELWIGSGNQIVPWNRAVALFHTVNAGKDWDTIILGHYILGVERLKFLSDSVGKVLCSDMMFHTCDGGESWASNYLDYNSSMNDIDWINDELFISVGINGYIFKSENSGYSWQDLKKGGNTSFRNIVVNDNQKGFAVGHEYGNASIYTSEDDGRSWNKYAFDTTYSYGYLNTIDFWKNDTGWIGGINGIMFKTNNGGETWIKANTGYNYTFYDIECIEGKYIWAGGHSGKLIKSNDFGDSWTDISTNYEDYQITQIQFLDSLTGYINLFFYDVYVDNKLLKTVDGGLTWTELDYMDDYNNKILYMDFVNKQTGFISIKYTGLYTDIDEGISSKIRNQTFVYPNPANNKISISNECKFESFRIYNINGECILEGNYPTKGIIDISFIKEGIYFLSLFNDNTVVNGIKFIKVK